MPLPTPDQLLVLNDAIVAIEKGSTYQFPVQPETMDLRVALEARGYWLRARVDEYGVSWYEASKAPPNMGPGI